MKLDLPLRLAALIIIINTFALQSYCQTIVDPCLKSIDKVGFFYGSADLQNVCTCLQRNWSSDLIEWDGSVWTGSLTYANVTLPPPSGCNNRALWIGNPDWTPDGEAFGLRLDNPLQTGKEYSFTFTYASDGRRSNGNFAPAFYTTDLVPYRQNSLAIANKVGNLPPAPRSWITRTFTFTATENQNGDIWIILHASESSGIVLSDCNFSNLPDEFLTSDIITCDGDTSVLVAPYGKYYQYQWNTGETTSSISVSIPGPYSVTITQGLCTTSDAIEVETFDCEVRLIMPNVFTPNLNDDYNKIFKPIDYNYLEFGTLKIINRWGDVLFYGDLFTGWDGTFGTEEASTGLYYYEVFYKDKNGETGTLKGPLSLIR